MVYDIFFWKTDLIGLFFSYFKKKESDFVGVYLEVWDYMYIVKKTSKKVPIVKSSLF